MRQGFTLIQISILLTVASLVLVNTLPGTQNILRANTNTTNKMNAVVISLRQYQASHGRLPCPADASLPIGASNYGVEAANAGSTNNCIGSTPAANYADTTNNIALGMIPVKSLGLSNDYSYDDFGRQITYAVDTNATAYGWAAATLTGKIVMTDNSTTVTSIVALVSHGADGHGAWIPLTGSSGTAVRFNAGSTDTDQLTNAHVNSSFVAASTLTSFVKKVATSTFDDLVVYKNPLWTMSIMPTQVPRISSITPPADGCYDTGQVLTFTLVYSKSVTVTGTPRLVLSALSGGTVTGNANYASGSGTSTLTFTYTVQVGDSATHGLSVAAVVDMNGGSIMTGNAYAITGFTAPDLTHVNLNNCTAIYVVDYGNCRVEKFDGSGNYLLQFGSCGSGNGQFNQPTGIAVDASGNVLVVDLSPSRVQKFDSSGNYLSQFGSFGTGNGQFEYPYGVAVDPSSGNIWVVDTYGDRIEKFDSSGNYLLQSGSWGSGNGQFSYYATAIGVTASGDVWTLDYDPGVTARAQKFNSSGTYQSQFGSMALNWSGGYFNAPKALAFDSGGNIWVVDAGLVIVQKFDSSGNYLSQFGSSGSGNGQFSGIHGIAIDGSGNIYVADGYNNRVQKFDSSGNYLSQFGTPGTGNGQFNEPYGIAISSGR